MWPKCKKKMRECDRSLHEDHCKKRMVPCGLGCGEMFPFALVDEHKRNACPKRQVPCTRDQCVRMVSCVRVLKGGYASGSFLVESSIIPS